MIITQTPLRISFFGGGTDYPEHFEKHGGAVLGTAVDKSAYFCLSRLYSKMFDYSLRIAYRKVECVSSIEELEHVPFRECLRWSGVERDIEINHSAELPAFTGLGSSSSFVVGLLNTLYAHRRKTLPAVELACEAIELERRVLRESVGCQDQVFAAAGGFNLVEFRGRDTITVHRVPLSAGRIREFEQHLLVFFTGIKRRAEELACRQVNRIAENLDRLRAIRSLVDEGYRILSGDGSLEPFGEMLHQSWMLKRELDDAISSDAIDDIYRAGLDAGAWGGKLLGAGGGGFVLFIVPPERRAAVQLRLRHLLQVDFRVNAPGSHVVQNGAARTPRKKRPLEQEALAQAS